MKQTIEIPEGFELKKVSDTEYQIVKKEVKLPKTWEEFCETHKIDTVNECFITTNSNIAKVYNRDNKNRYFQVDQNLLPDENCAKAILALCQLIQLRDCYRQGWKPDWNDENLKYSIAFTVNGKYVSCDTTKVRQEIFSFQSPGIRDEFLINFEDLLRTVGYLWW